MSTLGERIKLIRGRESQESFASKIGVSKGSLGGYERDANSPSADAILKICSGADISVEWLLRGLGPMRPGGETAAPRPSEEVGDLQRRNAALEAENKLLRELADDRKAMIETLQGMLPFQNTPIVAGTPGAAPLAPTTSQSNDRPPPAPDSSQIHTARK